MIVADDTDNRHAGVRAALCHDATSARLAREHNDANVLALGARLIAGILEGDMRRDSNPVATVGTSRLGGTPRRV